MLTTSIQCNCEREYQRSILHLAIVVLRNQTLVGQRVCAWHLNVIWRVERLLVGEHNVIGSTVCFLSDFLRHIVSRCTCSLWNKYQTVSTTISHVVGKCLLCLTLSSSSLIYTLEATKVNVENLLSACWGSIVEVVSSCCNTGSYSVECLID